MYRRNGCSNMLTDHVDERKLTDDKEEKIVGE